MQVVYKIDVLTCDMRVKVGQYMTYSLQYGLQFAGGRVMVVRQVRAGRGIKGQDSSAWRW